MRTHDLERALEALARKQFGAFHRRQVLDLGFTARMVHRRRSVGAWLTLAPAVYALSSHPFDWKRQVKAAELAVPDAVISHRTAAVLHRLGNRRPGVIELSVAAGARHRCGLARVHRTVDLEVARIDGIRVTPLSRTIIDLAGQLQPVEMSRVLDEVLLERRLAVSQLQSDIDRLAPGPGRGTKVLRQLLAARSIDAPVPPRNELERALDRVLRDPRLPASDREVDFGWWEGVPLRVDAVIWAWRRIVEVDGRRWHARVDDFSRDRARDHLAQRHGFEVTRFSYDQVVGQPGYAVETLLAIGRAGSHHAGDLRIAG